MLINNRKNIQTVKIAMMQKKDEIKLTQNVSCERENGIKKIVGTKMKPETNMTAK